MLLTMRVGTAIKVVTWATTVVVGLTGAAALMAKSCHAAETDKYLLVVVPAIGADDGLVSSKVYDDLASCQHDALNVAAGLEKAKAKPGYAACVFTIKAKSWHVGFGGKMS